jgi:hypothetical protein
MGAMSAQSLFFFTFHKCASVFFGRFVLRRARGLEQVDHAHRMFFDPTTAIEFAPRGHLYGPLRLSAQGAVLERLMVRDPRDMLVSQFFHNRDGVAIRSGLAAAETKERERSDAVRLGIDCYVLEKATRFEAGFDRAVRLLADRPATAVLRYEDMVDDWPSFLRVLREVFDLDEDALRDLERESRPGEIERPGHHKRSGATGDHRRKLAPESVTALTERFGPFLRAFGYLPR